jgi:hypothetical protein
MLGLSAALTLPRVASKPLKMMPAGVFAEERVKFYDVGHVSGVVNAPVYSPGAGRYDMGSLAQVSLSVPALAGQIWVYVTLNKADEENGIGWRVRGMAPPYDPLASRVRSGQQVFKLPANIGSTLVNVVVGTGFAGSLQAVQVVAIETVLAQPFDFYVCLGQSQMAATTNALGLAAELDHCSDPTLLYFPGATYAGHGTVIGQVEALRAPLQANAESLGGGTVTAGMRSNGVSPAIAFAKRIRQSTAAGRNVVIVQAAVSSTSLVGTAAAWNPVGSNPFAYNHAVSVIAGAMAASPVGSKIRGVLWAQGESDLAALAAYPAAWAAMRAAFEATWSANGWVTAPVPWLIGTTPPDAVHPSVPAFIDMQSQMDALSGHGYAQPRCRVVNRLPGIEPDGVHATAQSNRWLGHAMAERFLAAQ